MRLQILNIEIIQIMATEEDFSALSLNAKLLSIIYQKKQYNQTNPDTAQLT